MALTPVAELQNIIFNHIAQVNRVPEVEQIAITQATGRILAQNIISSLNVPDANVSAMDGYALAHSVQAGDVLALVGESSAGHPFTQAVQAGQCIRIMTGAVVPSDCVTVIMQENITVNEQGHIVINQDTPEKQNIRYAGEEVQQGQTVLTQGRLLRDADVLLLASLGIAEISVYRKIRVGVLSTGDELTNVGEALSQQGQIYDSNRPMLMARLQHLPIEVIDLNRVPDNLEAVLHALDSATQQCDVLITSGGVSVGDYDYLREAVERLGAIHHYKVAMKPGKPFVFGQMLKTWYFGLPGNAISSFVGFDMFVQSALWQLCGANPVPQPLRFQAVLTQAVKKAVGRMDIQRAQIELNADGVWTAQPCGKQDSHRILGTSQANAYLLIPEQSGNLAVGETVWVQPFRQAFL